MLDRDTIFPAAVVAAIESMGLEAKRTSYQSPWQPPGASPLSMVEGWRGEIGSVREPLLTERT